MMFVPEQRYYEIQNEWAKFIFAYLSSTEVISALANGNNNESTTWITPFATRALPLVIVPLICWLFCKASTTSRKLN